MSTFTATLDIQPDGTLHVPAPDGLCRGKVAIHATMEPADGGLPEDTERMEMRMNALRHLRASGVIHAAIPDPVDWQREQRGERPLPGRE
jgi:hypothetical protein